jgi:hypothetical protein
VLIQDLTTILVRRLRPLRLLIPALSGALIFVNVAAAQGPVLNEGWELLARYLYRDAGQVFEQTPSTNTRLISLGRAASLLNEPPVTNGKIEQAEQLLHQIVTGESNDTTALYARYLLARIYHMHREASVPEIEAAYRAVLQAGPGTAIAQIAASHLALVLLYQRTDLSLDQRLGLAQELESAAVGPALPEVAMSYYRLLADASLFYERVSPQVVDWLEQAHAIGSVDQLRQIDLALQIAETARAVGQAEKAQKYYREFLANAVPTDQRYNTVKLRLHELEDASS